MNIPQHFVDSIIDLACTIQQIPGPTFQETQRAAFLFKQFTALGLENVAIDSAGNVLGRLAGTGSARPLVVSAHLDTVHPIGTPLTLQRYTDRLIGPAIGDNSLGLAGLLALPRMLAQQQVTLPGDLWLAANVGEEGLGNLKGIQAVVDRFGSRPIAYLVLEGMGLGNVLHRGLGVERYKIATATAGGHSWADFGLPSAVHAICELVTRLTSIPLPTQPCTTLNVGVIQGGTSVNTIAANASIELDLRSEDNQALMQLVDQVHEIVRAGSQAGVRATIEMIGKRQAGSLRADHPLVGLAQKVLTEMGVEANLDIASTDANLPLSRGYPAICIGLTLGNNAHAKDEFILKAPVANGLRQVYELVTRVWEVMQ